MHVANRYSGTLYCISTLPAVYTDVSIVSWLILCQSQALITYEVVLAHQYKQFHPIGLLSLNEQFMLWVI